MIENLMFQEGPDGRTAARILDTLANLSSAQAELHKALLHLRVGQTPQVMSQLFEAVRSVHAAESFIHELTGGENAQGEPYVTKSL